MAKPILIVRLKGKPDPENMRAIEDHLTKKVGDEYFVLSVWGTDTQSFGVMFSIIDPAHPTEEHKYAL